MILNLSDIKTAVQKTSSNYDIKKVSLFGSYADGKANDESDIDLLVEFNDDENVSLFTIAGIKYDLEDKLHKSVDVIHAPIPKNSLIEIHDTVNLYG